MKGKREADNNFNFKSEKLDELRSRVDAAFDEHGDEAWEQIKGIFTHPKRLLVAALAAVLLVGVITVGGYLLKIRAPELPNRDGDTQDPGQTDVDLDYGDGVRPRVSGERKSKDFYTVLVLGRDTGGGGNTDTMLLASYDVTNQKATVMSIPRDTMVNVSWDVKKINSVYNYYGGGDKGIKALYKEISQLVGFEPDYQVVVEWEAVGAIVEAIGGVYFDVPYNMDYHDQYQDLVIEQEKGYRKLNGDDAMQVIRWRKNDSNSPYGNPQIGDSGRMQIQQDFLKAVIKQLLQLENVPNLGKLAEVFRENVETDLSFENILWFGKQAVIGGTFAGGRELHDHAVDGHIRLQPHAQRRVRQDDEARLCGAAGQRAAGSGERFPQSVHGEIHAARSGYHVRQRGRLARLLHRTGGRTARRRPRRRCSSIRTREGSRTARRARAAKRKKTIRRQR